MSKYTTEVRYICEEYFGANTSLNYPSINDIIQKALPKIFDFDFPVFDENYRSVLESKIIKHFYTREIGFETVALWKLKLQTKLQEIMPLYNQYYESALLEYNPLQTTNITTKSNRKTDSTSSDNRNKNTKTTGTDTTNITTNTKDTAHSKDIQVTDGNKWDLYSDTPQGGLTGVENETYLTNARKNTDDSTVDVTRDSNSTGSSTGKTDLTRNTNVNESSNDTGKRNNTDDYLENVTGFSSSNPSELIMKLRETFINIDMLVIDELEELFMYLW
nr:MAG TPA: Lower collar protein [Caudoviricetes sp.]